MTPKREDNFGASDGELVTVGEIAKLSGNLPSAVNNWEKRSPDFPKAAVLLDNGRRLFDLTEVLEWLKTNDKLGGEKSNPEKSAAFALFDLMRSWGLSGSDASLAACELVGVHAMVTKSAKARGWDIESMNEEAGDLAQDLEDSFGPDLFSTMRGSETWKEMSSAASELIGELDPVLVFDSLLEMGSNSRGPLEFYPVPAAVKELVVGVLPKHPHQAIDIAAGTADLLAEVALELEVENSTYADPFISWADISDMSADGDIGKVPVIGFEINPLRARLGQLRLSVHGINGVVRRFDALTSSPDFQGSIDALASIVPFGQKFAGESLEQLEWPFGAPARMDMSLGWIQRAIALLGPTGNAAVITALAPTFTNRRQDEAIRAELLRRSCVEALIELPGGTFSHTGIGSVLWLLRAPREVLRPEPVLLVDLAGGESTRRRGEEWSPGLASRAIAAVRRFRESPDQFSDEPSFARVVSTTELMSPKGSLLPSNYVRARADRSTEDLLETANQKGLLAQEALGALTGLGDLRAPSLLSRTAPAISTLQELADDSKLVIVRREHALPGDVLVGILRDKIVADVVLEECATGDHELVLRDFEHIFDAHFLAGAVTSTQNQLQGRRGTTIRRLDAKRIEVPLLPVIEQKILAEALSAPKVLIERSERLHRASDDWLQALIDSFAAGSVGVSPKKTQDAQEQ